MTVDEDEILSSRFADDVVVAVVFVVVVVGASDAESAMTGLVGVSNFCEDIGHGTRLESRGLVLIIYSSWCLLVSARACLQWLSPLGIAWLGYDVVEG